MIFELFTLQTFTNHDNNCLYSYVYFSMYVICVVCITNIKLPMGEECEKYLPFQHMNIYMYILTLCQTIFSAEASPCNMSLQPYKQLWPRDSRQRQLISVAVPATLLNGNIVFVTCFQTFWCSLKLNVCMECILTPFRFVKYI